METTDETDEIEAGRKSCLIASGVAPVLALAGMTRRELLDEIRLRLDADSDDDILPKLSGLHKTIDDSRQRFWSERQRADRAEKEVARAADWREDAEHAEALLRLFAEPCATCGKRGVTHALYNPDGGSTVVGKVVCPVCLGRRWIPKPLTPVPPVSPVQGGDGC